MLDAIPTLTGAAGGGVIGAVMGFAVKKVAKIFIKLAMVIVGLQLAIFAMAERYGLVNVDWNGVQIALVNFMGVTEKVTGQAVQATPTLMDTATASLPIGGGIVGGFLLGMKMG